MTCEAQKSGRPRSYQVMEPYRREDVLTRELMGLEQKVELLMVGLILGCRASFCCLICVCS